MKIARTANKVLPKLGQKRSAAAVLNLSTGCLINICAKLNRTGDPDLCVECPNFGNTQTVTGLLLLMTLCSWLAESASHFSFKTCLNFLL
jgi:hypothetical protein